MDKVVEYSTQMEIVFLRGLGTYREDKGVAERSSRVELLRKYIQAAAQRADWAKIDKKKVLAEANRMLAELVA